MTSKYIHYLREGELACGLGGSRSRKTEVFEDVTCRHCKWHGTRMSKEEAHARTQCTFCGGVAAERKMIIQGPSVTICDACVRLCVGFIEDRFGADAELSKPDAKRLHASLSMSM